MVQISEALRQAMAADKAIVTNYVHPHSLNSDTPVDPILRPKVGVDFNVDDAVLEGSCFPHSLLADKRYTILTSYN